MAAGMSGALAAKVAISIDTMGEDLERGKNVREGGMMMMTTNNVDDEVKRRKRRKRRRSGMP
jgi:hypothetical protein